MEATKEGRSLSDFKYTCVGYSVFLDTKNDNAEKPENQAELPFCAGIEVISCFYKLLKCILANVVFLFRSMCLLITLLYLRILAGTDS